MIKLIRLLSNKKIINFFIWKFIHKKITPSLISKAFDLIIDTSSSKKLSYRIQLTSAKLKKMREELHALKRKEKKQTSRNFLKFKKSRNGSQINK